MTMRQTIEIAHHRPNADIDLAEVKLALTERFRRSFNIETIGNGIEKFSISFAARAHVFGAAAYRGSVDVRLKRDGLGLRILISGETRPTRAIIALYALLVFILLLVGAIPGSFDTTDSGDALDALLILATGIFLMHDISQKLQGSFTMLDQIARATSVEFS